MGRSVRISEEGARALAGGASEAGANVAGYVRGLRELHAALARLDRIPKSKRLRKALFATARQMSGSVLVSPTPLSRKAEPKLRWNGYAKSRKPSREEKRDRRASIREKVFARADGQCEGPALSNPRWNGRCANPATDLQHVFGRGKGRMPESERNCLAACRTCHEAEGRNIPSSAAWWMWFAQWFQARGFTEEARRARSRARFDEVRANSPAAPRTQ
jgi:hypothetical protein